MSQGTCSLPGCGKVEQLRRGLCGAHYNRLRKAGKLPPKLPPIRDRFEEGFLVTESGCWEWQGARNDMGYGQLVLGGGKRSYAHRFSYEKFVGPIPDGLYLDHLCRNPPCCNPAHLEPVTHRENLVRGAGSGQLYRLGVCGRGHEMTGDNVLYSPSDPGKRDCRKCMHIRYLARKERLRLEQCA